MYLDGNKEYGVWAIADIDAVRKMKFISAYSEWVGHVGHVMRIGCSDTWELLKNLTN